MLCVRVCVCIYKLRMEYKHYLGRMDREREDQPANQQTTATAPVSQVMMIIIKPDDDDDDDDVDDRHSHLAMLCVSVCLCAYFWI